MGDCLIQVQLYSKMEVSFLFLCLHVFLALVVLFKARIHLNYEDPFGAKRENCHNNYKRKIKFTSFLNKLFSAVVYM